MAIFKPGQRVRQCGCRTPENSKFIGNEGTFVGYGKSRWHPYTDCLVKWDHEAEVFYEESQFLTPAQPERNRIVAWESLPIDPRKIGEIA